jgi:hypothetical protein
MEAGNEGSQHRHMRTFIPLLLLAGLVGASTPPSAARFDGILIDDFAADARSALGGAWTSFGDDVHGGSSTHVLERLTLDGRRCLRLRGEVRPDERSPGFVQAALDVTGLDAGSAQGIRLVTRGNGEGYRIHVRTADLGAPWEFYAAPFVAPAEWTVVDVPFASFEAQGGVEIALDRGKLRRIAIVASGAPRAADVAVARIELY